LHLHPASERKVARSVAARGDTSFHESLESPERVIPMRGESIEIRASVGEPRHRERAAL
jgi:hypothetical protein